jgi:hypothetical protein
MSDSIVYVDGLVFSNPSTHEYVNVYTVGVHWAVTVLSSVDHVLIITTLSPNNVHPWKSYHVLVATAPEVGNTAELSVVYVFGVNAEALSTLL